MIFLLVFPVFLLEKAFSVFSPSCTDQQLLVAADTDMHECLLLDADEEADQVRDEIGHVGRLMHAVNARRPGLWLSHDDCDRFEIFPSPPPPPSS